MLILIYFACSTSILTISYLVIFSLVLNGIIAIIWIKNNRKWNVWDRVLPFAI